VSREAVEEAHDALITAGLVPSVRSVREKLGDTGSLTTIAGHLRALQIDRANGPDTLLPDALVRGLVAGAGELWQDVTAAADAQVEAINASATAKVTAMRVEAEEAVAKAALASHELGAARAVIGSLEDQLKRSNARVERLEGQLDEMRAATRTADEAANRRREERDTLEHELDLTRTRARAEQAIADRRQTGQQERIDALQALVEQERTQRADETRALGASVDEQALRANELGIRLARSEERLAAAESLAERNEQRAVRSETAAGHGTRRHERAMGELVEARRIDVLACHARIERLSGLLIEARLPEPHVSGPLPSAEVQAGFAFDEGTDEG